MAQIRVREVVGTMKVVDSDALLTGPVLERIVHAVVQALAASSTDDRQRRRDVRIGESCDECEGAKP